MDSFDIKGIKLSNCLVLRIDDILYKSYKCLFDKIKSKSKIHSYLFENLDINLFESIVHLYDLYNISSILKTRQLDSFIPFISNESIKQKIGKKSDNILLISIIKSGICLYMFI